MQTYCITWGIIVNFDRRSLSPIFAISKPSISMLPSAASRMRNIASAIVDFPAPVRPTIPIYKRKHTFLKLDIWTKSSLTCFLLRSKIFKGLWCKFILFALTTSHIKNMWLFNCQANTIRAEKCLLHGGSTLGKTYISIITVNTIFLNIFWSWQSRNFAVTWNLFIFLYVLLISMCI